MVHLSALNPQQREAVQTIRGPVLILAGAGTGKTRVITHRIAHMIECGVAPENILAVTFTNKAAREMQARILKLLPRPSRRSDARNRPTICTFHSLCVRVLRQHIDKLGYKRNFVIYNESEQLASIKKVLSNFSIPNEKLDPHLFLSQISRVKNDARYQPSQISLDFLQRVSKRYQDALKACNAVDFDDLIALTLRLFQDHPEALDASRDKFRYVMVDEYQDTNLSQFELVHALTRQHRNLCVVGDDDQSIYGWRGAEVANLLNLEQHFPEVKIVKLEQNYRSTNVILAAANAVIKNNAQRRPKELWSEQGRGAPITLYALESDDAEAQMVVDQIEVNRHLHRIPWKDHAILFRTNQQSRPLELALRQAGIRYHLIGGQSFFDRREVRDFLAYLKLLQQPDDDISLLRIANVPARGLSDTTMHTLLAASEERKCSVLAAMCNPAVQMTFPARPRAAISRFIDLINDYRGELKEGLSLPLSQWAEQFLKEIGYFDELRRSEKDAEVAENRIENLKNLLITLEETAPAKPPLERIEAFLEDITLDSDRSENKENEQDAVTLITMHSCKGLEYPHVFIVGLEDGLLPHSRSTVENTIDEERRLLYVAITRARQTLSISHCATRKKYGQPMPCHPSRFLAELPAQLLEMGEEKAKKPVAVQTGQSLFAGIRSAIG